MRGELNISVKVQHFGGGSSTLLPSMSEDHSHITSSSLTIPIFSSSYPDPTIFYVKSMIGLVEDLVVESGVIIFSLFSHESTL